MIKKRDWMMNRELHLGKGNRKRNSELAPGRRLLGQRMQREAEE